MIKKKAFKKKELLKVLSYLPDDVEITWARVAISLPGLPGLKLFCNPRYGKSKIICISSLRMPLGYLAPQDIPGALKAGLERARRNKRRADNRKNDAEIVAGILSTIPGVKVTNHPGQYKEWILPSKASQLEHRHYESIWWVYETNKFTASFTGPVVAHTLLTRLAKARPDLWSKLADPRIKICDEE